MPKFLGGPKLQSEQSDAYYDVITGVK